MRTCGIREWEFVKPCDEMLSRSFITVLHIICSTFLEWKQGYWEEIIAWAFLLSLTYFYLKPFKWVIKEAHHFFLSFVPSTMETENMVQKNCPLETWIVRSCKKKRATYNMLKSLFTNLFFLDHKTKKRKIGNNKLTGIVCSDNPLKTS